MRLIPNKNKIFAIAFVLLSVGLFWKAGQSLSEHYKTIPVENLSLAQLNSENNANSLMPIEIAIPKLEINLPINEATIKDGRWVFEGGGAFYLNQSPIPGDKGNSIIFGHNFPNVFGKLRNVQKGDLISVTLKNGTKRDFKVEYTQNVTPDQTHVLNSTNDTRLTIYTCSGFLDLKRLLVVATPLI
jgi:LPXTG-site transpeptidase (sortase) family protein